MGQDPPAFDILAWNDDSPRLPGALVRQLLGIAEGYLLAAPGGVTLLGTPVDLAAVKVRATWSAPRPTTWCPGPRSIRRPGCWAGSTRPAAPG